MRPVSVKYAKDNHLFYTFLVDASLDRVNQLPNTREDRHAVDSDPLSNYSLSSNDQLEDLSIDESNTQELVLQSFTQPPAQTFGKILDHHNNDPATWICIERDEIESESNNAQLTFKSSQSLVLHHVGHHQHEGTVTLAEIYQPKSENDTEKSEYVEPIARVSEEAGLYIKLQRGCASRHLYEVTGIKHKD